VCIKLTYRHFVCFIRYSTVTLSPSHAAFSRQVHMLYRSRKVVNLVYTGTSHRAELRYLI